MCFGIVGSYVYYTHEVSHIELRISFRRKITIIQEQKSDWKGYLWVYVRAMVFRWRPSAYEMRSRCAVLNGRGIHCRNAGSLAAVAVAVAF